MEPCPQDEGDSGRSDPASLIAGPWLYLREATADRVGLSIIAVVTEGTPAPTIETVDGLIGGQVIHTIDGHDVLRYGVDVKPSAFAWYRIDGRTHPVDTDYAGDLRIAFVSCNGQEHEDRGRDAGERNALWRRLGGEHRERPFQLLLHGGDQVYADEILGMHPRLRAWSRGEARATADLSATERAEVSALLDRAFFRLYLDILGQDDIAWMLARVPSLEIWDDHDICDGWGSLPEERLDAPTGRLVFETARRYFMMFQLGVDPSTVPGTGTDGSPPALGWHMRLPGVDIIAPDLRSQRRPDRVMAPSGWQALDTALGTVRDGRVLLLSTVPALGPRLSWVEALMQLTPHAEKYEDDLRDQWQSRAHRAEWQAFLKRLVDLHESGRTRVTVLSGEIHLATRATLAADPEPIHQLVASGIAHPAPPAAYAKTLGWLARLGEAPLPDRPIRLHPLPGHRAIYAAERNYLVLERQGDAWNARWMLEHAGATEPLPI